MSTDKKEVKDNFSLFSSVGKMTTGLADSGLIKVTTDGIADSGLIKVTTEDFVAKYSTVDSLGINVTGDGTLNMDCLTANAFNPLGVDEKKPWSIADSLVTQPTKGSNLYCNLNQPSVNYGIQPSVRIGEDGKVDHTYNFGMINTGVADSGHIKVTTEDAVAKYTTVDAFGIEIARKGTLNMDCLTANVFNPLGQDEQKLSFTVDSLITQQTNIDNLYCNQSQSTVISSYQDKHGFSIYAKPGLGQPLQNDKPYLTYASQVEAKCCVVDTVEKLPYMGVTVDGCLGGIETYNAEILHYKPIEATDFLPKPDPDFEKKLKESIVEAFPELYKMYKDSQKELDTIKDEKMSMEIAQVQMKKENQAMRDCLNRFQICEYQETPSGDVVVIMTKGMYDSLIGYKRTLALPCKGEQAQAPLPVVSILKEDYDERKIKEKLISIFGKCGEKQMKYLWRAVLNVLNEYGWSRKTKISLKVFAEWVNTFIDYSGKSEKPLNLEHLRDGKSMLKQEFKQFQILIENTFIGNKVEKKNSNGHIMGFTFENEKEWTKDRKTPFHVAKVSI